LNSKLLMVYTKYTNASPHLAVAIGGGDTNLAKVTITGGTVVAYSETDGAGIGVGMTDDSYRTITISGGTIITSGGKATGYSNVIPAITGAPVIFSPQGMTRHNTAPSNGRALSSGDVTVTPVINGDAITGTIALNATFTVPSGATLTVPPGMIVPPGWTLNTNSNLTNNGTIVNKGTISGSVTGNQPVN
jgi:hypothetical protein